MQPVCDVFHDHQVDHQTLSIAKVLGMRGERRFSSTGLAKLVRSREEDNCRIASMSFWSF